MRWPWPPSDPLPDTIPAVLIDDAFAVPLAALAPLTPLSSRAARAALTPLSSLAARSARQVARYGECNARGDDDREQCQPHD